MKALTRLLCLKDKFLSWHLIPGNFFLEHFFLIKNNLFFIDYRRRESYIIRKVTQTFLSFLRVNIDSFCLYPYSPFKYSFLLIKLGDIYRKPQVKSFLIKSVVSQFPIPGLMFSIIHLYFHSPGSYCCIRDKLYFNHSILLLYFGTGHTFIKYRWPEIIFTFFLKRRIFLIPINSNFLLSPLSYHIFLLRMSF